MSKTPRTDEEEFLARRDGEGRWMQVVESSVSRQLEAENAELRASVQELLSWIDGEQLYPNSDAPTAARALLARVNGE